MKQLRTASLSTDQIFHVLSTTTFQYFRIYALPFGAVGRAAIHPSWGGC